MFLSRLDDAIRESQRATKSVSHSLSPAKHTERETPRKAVPEVLRELNEYLFDLFDANMTEDFHVMHACEERALKVFERDERERERERERNETKSATDGDEERDRERERDEPHALAPGEFSHEMHALHTEFLALFEGLIARFLRTSRYETEEIYDALHRYYMRNKAEKAKERESERVANRYDSKDETESEKARESERETENEALEVLDVLAFYTDFSLWCTMMRQTAQHRMRFMKEKSERDNSAFAVSASYFEEKNSERK